MEEEQQLTKAQNNNNNNTGIHNNNNSWKKKKKVIVKKAVAIGHIYFTILLRVIFVIYITVLRKRMYCQHDDLHCYQCYELLVFALLLV